MIKGKIVDIRILQKSDSEIIRNWKNSDHNYKYFANRNFISDLKQEKWISSKLNDDSSFYFIIIDKASKKLIGMTLLEDVDQRNRNACWGIYISDLNFRKRVYALEETMLILNYAFDYLNLNKVYGNTLSNNSKGRGFHSLVGFNEEATFKNHIFIDGKYIDLIWISLFIENWSLNKSKILNLINDD